MISRDEIDAKSAELGVDPSHVQRDYVFGWFLAGLYGESRLADRLVLKGGNALRKGYFGATRFSEDLDFASPGPVDVQDFLEALNDIGRMAQARTGVQFHLDRTEQLSRDRINREQTVYTYQLLFTDFYGTTGSVPVSLHLDVTEFTRLQLPPQSRTLIHPYSDQAACTADLTVISLEEALADKLKCLLQRRSIRDLFDLTYSTFVNSEIPVNRRSLVSTFLRKTIFAPSPAAALNLLTAIPFDSMQSLWDTTITCARDSLPEFTSTVARWKSELDLLFADFRTGHNAQAAFYPAHLRMPIMEAGAERKLMLVTYEGHRRLVEPYALRFKRRTDGVGQEYLYVYDRTGGRSGPGIKSFFHHRISDLSVTDEHFEPQYEIELSKAGEFSDRLGFSRGRTIGRRPAAARPRPRVPRRR
ncbi:nucleotidyl transferase AbiEii/AbiGii toxin family protein [Streptomyces violaceusniger]